MIRSEKDFVRAQKEMILKIQKINSPQEVDTYSMSAEQAEVLMSCIKAGYLVGRYEKNGVEMRTLDGKAHPELLSTQITPLGAAFLKPIKTDAKATFALLVSVVALIVSILSDFPTIYGTIRSLVYWLKLIATK